MYRNSARADTLIAVINLWGGEVGTREAGDGIGDFYYISIVDF